MLKNYRTVNITILIYECETWSFTVKEDAVQVGPEVTLQAYIRSGRNSGYPDCSGFTETFQAYAGIVPQLGRLCLPAQIHHCYPGPV